MRVRFVSTDITGSIMYIDPVTYTALTGKFIYCYIMTDSVQLEKRKISQLYSNQETDEVDAVMDNLNDGYINHLIVHLSQGVDDEPERCYFDGALVKK